MSFWTKILRALGFGPVKFVRRYSERRQFPMGPATCSYEIFRADTAQAARDFLSKKNVTQPLHYLIVETPEGNWGKDIKGTYKEKLRDISGAVVYKEKERRLDSSAAAHAPPSSSAPKPTAREDSSKPLEMNRMTRQQMDLLWRNRQELASMKVMLCDPNSAITYLDNTGKACDLKKAITVSDIEWAEKVVAITEMADAASQRGDYTTAIQLYEQALERAPDCDLCLMSIGACFSNMGKHREGLPYLERAAEINPNNTRIRTNLSIVLTSTGWSLAKTGKPRDGLPYLERALKINPNEIRIQNALTSVRQMLRK